ncbi:MAG: hypothetical protein K2H43_07520, partial [Clostridia bacterium]|nr:hypothetical protein [Clostridia bacterium]
TLSMGVLSACGGTNSDDGDDDDDNVETETDTQLLQNGNFEFYSDKEKDFDDKRTFLYSPSSWSFTSGSPSSDTQSGIVNLDEWDQITKPALTGEDKLVQKHTETTDDGKTEEVNDDASIAIPRAIKNWEKASIYDRLEFLEEYKTEIAALSSDSEEKKHFDKYSYTFDFEDVKSLNEIKDLKTAHDGNEDKEDETHLLMIHNSRTSDGVVGTGQYYTSSTTITLPAGTAAEVSVSVRTSELYHYSSGENDGKGIAVNDRAGAYIGVTHTVGGTTLDQMQIKNINTKDEWQTYTVYVRANTYATSTFRLVLGLGQSSSDNRYEAVDGYAFFDDVNCTLISSAEYDAATETGKIDKELNLESTKDQKLCDAKNAVKRVYALDLKSDEGFAPYDLTEDGVKVGLTTETSGSQPYTSETVAGLGDNRGNGEADSIGKLTSLDEIKNNTVNKYLTNIAKNDFADYPENFNREDIVLLLSTNGAAYTATLPSIKVEKEKKMLISFFVKTSSIRSGKTGASITLVDGENETVISAFDSTTVATVDINDERKDIYDGWVQCFFFVENETETDKEFYLKLSYGPTSISGTSASDYCDGYAAFANFEQIEDFSATKFKYVSTGDRAKTVSLTGEVSPTDQFAAVSVTSDIEKDLAKPVGFNGVQSGSANMKLDGHINPSQADLNAAGLYTGLLNAKYAKNYTDKEWSSLIGAAGSDWWKDTFGDANKPAVVANQPLVIANTSKDELPAYGFFANTTSVGSNSYQKISMNVKLSKGAKAYVYLIDTSDSKQAFNSVIAPAAPKVTYWYDDEGNICKIDPSDSSLTSTASKRANILYYKQDNGLYKSADTADTKYYANLYNYKNYEADAAQRKDNLLTSSDAIAYYCYEGAYYAYYDKTKTGAAAYSQPVETLPTALSDGTVFARYRVSDADLAKYGSCIVVEGTEDDPKDAVWQEIAFYIHTGSEAKNYRLEIWVGDRTCDYNKEANTFTAGTGIPGNSWIFFDNYKSESISNYADILGEIVSEIKEELNAGKQPGSEGYLGDDDNLPSEYAAYSTFTFYDSPAYVRYDASLDEDGLGDPHGSYKQSTYSEQ